MSTILLIMPYTTTLFIIISALPNVEILNYLPMMQSDWSKIFHASLVTFAPFGQVVGLTMVYPYIRNSKGDKVTKSLILGRLVAFFTVGIEMIEEIVLFSAYQMQSLTSPSFELVSLVRIGDFFERAEILFVLVWLFNNLLVAGFWFSISHIALTQILDRSESHGSRISLGIIVFLL